jgi:ADP-ribosylglycohydrolase
MDLSLADRLAGAVWGHLVGDAVGVPYEFMSASYISNVEFGVTGTHRQPPGTWSDDGALMLATLDSLLRDGTNEDTRFDASDQAQRFLAWADKGAYTPDGDGRFDIGNATSAGLSAVRRGTPAEKAGGTDERSNGNGSLMRILPLALVERDVDDETLVEHAHRSSAITHGHPYSKATCALYVLVARRLIGGSPRARALEDARARLRVNYQARPDSSTWLDALDHIETYPTRSGSGYVVNAFRSAWDALAGATAYRDTIERAVRYGNDTDTTACIAGGLAGLRWGIDGIPAEWLAGMRGRDIVEPLIARLTATASIADPQVPDRAHTSTSHPIQVDWVDPSALPTDSRWKGRLGMTFLPGKWYPGRLGTAHARDLAADVERLRAHWAVDTFVLLVEDHELVETRTSDIASRMAAHGIDLVRFPVTDLDVPTDIEATRGLLESIGDRLRAGSNVVVACLGGLGRTGTIIGSLLVEAGLSGDDAIVLTRKTRHGTIQTSAQETFVRRWRARGSDGDREPG